jgi:small-conductance mechanosensitive channel
MTCNIRAAGRACAVALACLLAPAFGLAADKAPDITEDSPLDTHFAAPVVVDGVALFKVRGVSSLPAAQRAKVIGDRIVALAADARIQRDALRQEERPEGTAVMAGDKLVMMVLDADARLEGVDRPTLARVVVAATGEAIDAWRADRTANAMQRQALVAVAATLGFALVVWLALRLARLARGFVDRRTAADRLAVRFGTFDVVRAQQVRGMLLGLVTAILAATVLVALYFYLGSVLSLFPWTRGFATDLFQLVTDPLRTLALDFVRALPSLMFLVVLFFIARYLLKLLKLYFERVADGRIVVTEFDAEWAWPTYRLLRLLLIGLAVIVAYPYIPGSDSAAFKGVSIFAGVVFSLGSSSLIGNMIAGYTMTYRRIFKVGDRIAVSGHTGDVEQVRMLVTYLRTPKNELVAIPNSTILNSEVVNYSTHAKERGLVLHTTVGIGYETPWRQVEAMLLEAAARTPGLMREPAPFVLQKGLGDFAITYELNVHCSNAQAMNQLYTELHRSILDVFNHYGVQIMTPAYEGDPEQPKLVPPEQWYTAPARPPADVAVNAKAAE